MKKHSQKDLFGPLTSSQEASPVKTSHGQARGQDLVTTYLRERVPGLVFGGKCGESYAFFDPATSLLKTYQRSLIEDSTLYSEALPKSGMMRSGKLYRRRRWVPRTLEKESSLWPTAVANDDNKSVKAHLAMKHRMGGGREKITSLQVATKDATSPVPLQMWPTSGLSRGSEALGGNPGPSASNEERMWATPRTSMHKANGHEPSSLKRIAEQGAANIEEQAAERTNWKGWRLSVTFVEWLMGFPVGWSRKEEE
jgi:hypothetical protein